jgi:translocation and assembly module TamB
VSAAPSLPPDFREPAEPPRKPPRRWNWKRVLACIGAIGLILLGAAVAVAVVLLRSPAFHHYVLGVAEQKAEAALGTKVQAQEFALHFSGVSPRLDLYGITLQGAPPHTRPPLLQADHLRISVNIVSVLRRTWYLNEVRLEHPVLHIFMDAKGASNLPQLKSSGHSQTNIFDLGVRHAVLDRGEVYYNNQKSALNADLRDLWFQSAFHTALKQYSGAIGYREGQLRLGSYAPIPHNLEARFTATPAAFSLPQAVVTSGRSRMVLSGTLQDYASPRFQAHYDAVLDAGELRRITRNNSLPQGTIRLAGALQYARELNRPMLESLFTQGNLSSAALRMQASGLSGDVTDVAAKYTIRGGNLEVRDLRAHLLGGELTGGLSVKDLAGASRSQLHAELHDVSLAEIKRTVQSPSIDQVSLLGMVNASVDAAWGTTINTLIANSDVTINGRARPSKSSANASGAQNSIPLNGTIHARYVAAEQQITLRQSLLRTPDTSLLLDGTVSRRSALAVRLRSGNLHELETVAGLFRTPAAGQPVQPLGLYGIATFNGKVRGSASAPEIAGQVTAANLRLRGSEWRSLQTTLAASPSGIKLHNGQLQPAGHGRVDFNLAAGLKHWAFTTTSPVEVSLRASQLNLAQFSKAAGAGANVSGTVSADVFLHGSELNPAGYGTVTVEQANISNQKLPPVRLNFEGSGETLNVRLTAGPQRGMGAVMPHPAVAKATVTLFPRQRAYQGQLQITGFQLQQLSSLKALNLQLSGILNLTASGRGTFDNPALQATLQIPQLSVQEQQISGLRLQTDIANHVASFALDSEVVNATVRGRGTVKLTGTYDSDITLDSQTIPLQPLVAAFLPAQAGNLSGETELHATVRGPLRDRSRLDAHITVPRLAVNFKNAVQLGAAGPIHIDYTGGVLQLQRAAIRGTGTDLQFQGTIPASRAAPVSLLLRGAIDLRLAQLFDPDVTSSGELRFNIDSYGKRSDPNVQGEIQIVNAAFATGSSPLGLQNGNGILTLTKDRLNITHFQGSVGGGNVTASGGVLYRPELQFDLALAGRDIRLLYPDGVRSQLSANLALSGTPQSSLLRGQVGVMELQFTPDFDLMNFAGQFGAEASVPPGQGFSNNLKLDIAVASSGGLNPVSRTLSLQAMANLRVRGTAAEPVVLGRVNLTGGDLIFSGNRYVLQGGTVDFLNPARTEPLMNVNVSTTIQQYNINMRFTGPLDALRTNYSSDPALPPADIINLVAFGKTTEAAAANPAPGNLAAESAVASQVSGQVTSRVERIAGISHISVDPLLGCNQQSRGTCVTIQQRVTGKIFVTFGTDVTSVQNQTIKLEYQQSPRVSYSATRDQNGGFGFDVRLHRSW